MKKIVIVRHGKSEKETINDFDRRLAEKGAEDVKELGKVIEKLEGTPDLMITSPAKRAVETTGIIAEECNYKGEMVKFDFLYPGEATGIEKVLKEVEGSAGYIIVTGHNPASERAASRLAAKKENLVHLSTSSAICLQSDVNSWKDFLKEETHEIQWILNPKVIKALKK